MPGQERIVINVTYDSFASSEGYTDDYLAAIAEWRSQTDGASSWSWDLVMLLVGARLMGWAGE